MVAIVCTEKEKNHGAGASIHPICLVHAARSAATSRGKNLSMSEVWGGQAEGLSVGLKKILILKLNCIFYSTRLWELVALSTAMYEEKMGKTFE